MKTAAQDSPASLPPAAALERAVRRLRRRARLALLGTAVIGAAAADIWYDLATYGIALVLKRDIYFPLFFLVIYGIFGLRAVLQTRLEVFSRALDARFGLKERLGAAAAYRASARIPPAVVEAQARESLRAVDFTRLRAGHRFRPYGALGALAVGVCITGWVLWRFPGLYRPQNLVFREGRTLVNLAGHLTGGGRQTAGGSRSGTGGRERRSGDGTPTQDKGLSPSAGDPQARTAEKPNADPGTKPPPPPAAAKKADPAPGDKRPGDGRSVPGDQDTGRRPRQSDDSSAASSREYTWRREEARLYEESQRISPITGRPEGAAGSPFSDLRTRGGSGALPPLPFFRLLAGPQPADGLLDPETIAIIVEAYPLKYRPHLEAYLKALQVRREERHGS